MLNLFTTTSLSTLTYATTTPAASVQSYIATPYALPAETEYAAIEIVPVNYTGPSGGGADDSAPAVVETQIGPLASDPVLANAAASEIAPVISVDPPLNTDMVAHGTPLEGTQYEDRLDGTNAAEGIAGYQGADVLYGHGGNDLLLGGDGADYLVGGRGDDVLYGENGNDIFDCPYFDATGYAASGADQMYGGAGDDTYYVDNAGDKVFEYEGYGKDTVITSLGEYTLNANVEELVSEIGTDFHGIGNELDNTITSYSGSDWLEGGAGNDRLEAGGGEDTLIGGEGHDVMVGGAGADIFRFSDGDSGIDTIKDFKAGEGDRLDFSGMSGLATFDDLSITMTTSGAIVSYGEVAVVLEGITATSLTEDMFIFG